jgi:hypothetical protein
MVDGGHTVGDVNLKYGFVLLRYAQFVRARVRDGTCPARETTVPFGRIEDVKHSGGKRGNGSDHRPPGQDSRRDSCGYAVGRVTDLPADLSGLAAEFPGYEFAKHQTSGGISIVARRHGGCARPGLYVVITDDLDEMRRALLEQEAAQLTRQQPSSAVRGDL